MIAALALLLLASNPAMVVAEDRVTTIELNVVYCGDDGRDVLRQVIFWQEEGGVYRVRDWRLYRDWPIERDRGGWLMRFHDGDQLREIRAVHFARTWRPWDEELRQRELCPMELRAHLFEAIRTGNPVEVVR